MGQRRALGKIVLPGVGLLHLLFSRFDLIVEEKGLVEAAAAETPLTPGDIFDELKLVRADGSPAFDDAGAKLVLELYGLDVFKDDGMRGVDAVLDGVARDGLLPFRSVWTAFRFGFGGDRAHAMRPYSSERGRRGHRWHRFHRKV